MGEHPFRDIPRLAASGGSGRVPVPGEMRAARFADSRILRHGKLGASVHRSPLRPRPLRAHHRFGREEEGHRHVLFGGDGAGRRAARGAIESSALMARMMSGRPLLVAAVCGLAILNLEARGVPEDIGEGLRWRLIGPLRAGWGTAVAGIVSQPDTYYFGAAGGGVWKTTDAGHTWSPLFEQGPASIGAIAIATSDPRTIYVGTGQISTRYDIAAGEGMFRSDDGGVSWHAAGLEQTRHIAAILIDPRDARTVLVAALGHVFGPHAQRGVFRTENGGRSWERTLFVSERTGAVDLAVDPQDPDLVFAAVWQVRYWPWLSYFMPTVGAESGLYKSTDGGRPWARLAGHGWPEGALGRIALAATRTAQGARAHAAVDAVKNRGLYRC